MKYAGHCIKGYHSALSFCYIKDYSKISSKPGASAHSQNLNSMVGNETEKRWEWDLQVSGQE